MPAVFLVGFMASGKTRVSELVAAELKLPCLDLDHEIETRAGKTISAIFEESGEPEFRKLESEVLRELSTREAVLATGGGTPCFGDNLAVMRSRGIVVHLATELEVALSRVQDPSSRPLLAQPAPAIRALYEQRQTSYRRAQLHVATDERTPHEVAELIAKSLRATSWLSSAQRSGASIVTLGERSYPVLCQEGLLGEIGAVIRAVLPGTNMVGLVSDSNVGPLYGDACRETLEAHGLRIARVEVPAGETAKTLSTYERVCEELIAAGLDRSSAIIALGGGVVGDLAGFVAASLFRGIALVQAPTTLLAMTDSAIGGKTGINSAHGKNLIGAFWQPRAVLADPRLLVTLPARERRAAFGELVKYALLDAELMPEMRALAPRVGREDLHVDESLVELVRRCAGIKVAIVSADEREQGLRATLNLGHTIGHAIEAAAGYGTVLHGEAVALGLLAACRVSRALQLCDATLEADVAMILAAAGLDTELEPWLRADVLERVSVDKKRTGDQVRFVTVRAPGSVGLHALPIDDLKRMLST